jgi:hypothetical protein
MFSLKITFSLIDFMLSPTTFSRMPDSATRLNVAVPCYASGRERGSLHRLDDMMGIVGCGFETYTRQYE